MWCFGRSSQRDCATLWHLFLHGCGSSSAISWDLWPHSDNMETREGSESQGMKVDWMEAVPTMLSCPHSAPKKPLWNMYFWAGFEGLNTCWKKYLEHISCSFYAILGVGRSCHWSCVFFCGIIDIWVHDDKSPTGWCCIHFFSVDSFF